MSVEVDIIMQYLADLLLPFMRISGLFASLVGFSAKSFPMTTRALLTLFLTILIMPVIPPVDLDELLLRVNSLLKRSGKVFKEIKLNQEIEVDNCILKPIQNNHTDSSCGYVIQKNNSSILFTSDTYVCKNIWDEVNNNKQIEKLKKERDDDLTNRINNTKEAITVLMAGL